MKWLRDLIVKLLDKLAKHEAKKVKEQKEKEQAEPVVPTEPVIEAYTDVTRDPSKRSANMGFAACCRIPIRLVGQRFEFDFDSLPWPAQGKSLARLCIACRVNGLWSVQSFAGWVPKSHPSWSARNEWANWHIKRREPAGELYACLRAPARGIKQRSEWVPIGSSTPAAEPSDPDPSAPSPCPGNEPPITADTDTSKWSTNTKRNYDAPLSAPAEFHGRIEFADHEQATNFRYRLRSHFEWDLNRRTGYSTAGMINIVVLEQVLTWQVV